MNTEELDNQIAVRVLYRALLGREPDPGGLVHYMSFLDSGSKTFSDLASELMRSREFQSREFPPKASTRAIPRAAPALPAISISQVCRFGLPVRILEPDGVGGNVSFIELIVLNHLVAAHNPKVVFEFGTFDGRTTLNLAANTADNALIYTLDLPQSQMNEALLTLEPADRKYLDKEMSGVRFEKTQESHKIVQLFGDTAVFDFTKWHNEVDLVFIDASHSAEYVQNDTEIAAKLIGGRHGLIAWHDYGGWPGVTKVLGEYQRGDRRFSNLVHISGTSIAVCDFSG